MAEEGDHITPPIRMDQSMSIAANMVAGLIGQFGKPDDTEEELSALHLTCLAVFLHQLTAEAKHKDKVVSILEIIIQGLKDER